MIDEGELDWKIVAISLDDPKAPLVNDIDDVEKHFPVCFNCFSNAFFIFFLLKIRLAKKGDFDHYRFNISQVSLVVLSVSNCIYTTRCAILNLKDNM